jgi:hypothetical protein
MRKQGSAEDCILLNEYCSGDQIKKNKMSLAFGIYGVLVGKPDGIYRNCTGKGNHCESGVVIINHISDPCETV